MAPEGQSHTCPFPATAPWGGQPPAVLGHPHSPLRPTGSCLSGHPLARRRLRAARGWGGQAAAHIPPGRQRAARRGRAPGSPTASGAAAHQGSPAGGRRLLGAGAGSWRTGPGSNGVPPPVPPPEKRACSRARPVRLQTASPPPHYFFHRKNYLLPYQ